MARLLLDRLVAFIGASSTQELYAEQMRARLLVGSSDEDLERDSERIAEEEFGPYQGDPFEDPESAEEHYGLKSSYRYQRLQVMVQTRSYLRALAISGLYHLREQETRSILIGLRVADEQSLAIAGFGKLVATVEKSGFPLRMQPHFAGLELGYRISNVAKHASRTAVQSLQVTRPELFDGYDAARPATRLRPEDLRVGVREFDEVNSALIQLWERYEDVATPL